VTDALFAATAIAAVLATAAGLAKLVRPHHTAVAVGAVVGRAVPLPDAAVRAGAALEAAVGVAALGGWRPAILALAASYGAFAAFVTAALASGRPISSCGCFGEPDVPPTRLHVAFDAAAASAAALLATSAGPLPSVVSTLRSQPLGGVPWVLLVGAGAGAAYLVLGELPKLQVAVAAVVAARKEAS